MCRRTDEYLRKPVVSGAAGVAVVPRGARDRVELEEVEQELHPLGRGYLERVEYGAGEGSEGPPAPFAQAPLPSEPILREAPVRKRRGPAEGAFFVPMEVGPPDEGGGGASVLGVVPFDEGLLQELGRVLAVGVGKIGELRELAPVILFSHFGGLGLSGAPHRDRQVRSGLPLKGLCLFL